MARAHIRGRAQAQGAPPASLAGREPPPLGGPGLADALVRVRAPRKVSVVIVQVRGYLHERREGRELERRDQGQQRERPVVAPRRQDRRRRRRRRQMSEEDFGMIADHPQRQGVADQDGDDARREGVRPRGQLPNLELGRDRALLPLIVAHGQN